MTPLKQIIENTDSFLGKAFGYSVQGLILLSLVSFSIETLPGLNESTREFLQILEVSCVLIFTVEYFLRLYVASKKISHIFSFYSIVDLVAILPFYLSTGLDLRAVRAFRLLRIFRILKLARYGKAMKRFRLALMLAKAELVLFLSLSGILVYLSAVGIYYFENSVQPEVFQSIFHSLWWAIVTLTTVGYGDMYPVTAGGRVFTFVILIIGLGLVSVPAGLVASALTEARESESNQE